MRGFLQVFVQKYVVIIIVVLILSVLVVVSIMQDRVLQTLGVVNPLLEEKALENQCRERCTSWCSRHLGQPGTSWDELVLYLPRGEVECGEVMQGILGNFSGECKCGTL